MQLILNNLVKYLTQAQKAAEPQNPVIVTVVGGGGENAEDIPEK